VVQVVEPLPGALDVAPEPVHLPLVPLVGGQAKLLQQLHSHLPDRSSRGGVILQRVLYELLHGGDLLFQRLHPAAVGLTGGAGLLGAELPAQDREPALPGTQLAETPQAPDHRVQVGLRAFHAVQQVRVLVLGGVCLFPGSDFAHLFEVAAGLLDHLFRGRVEGRVGPARLNEQPGLEVRHRRPLGQPDAVHLDVLGEILSDAKQAVGEDDGRGRFDLVEPLAQPGVHRLQVNGVRRVRQLGRGRAELARKPQLVFEFVLLRVPAAGGNDELAVNLAQEPAAFVEKPPGGMGHRLVEVQLSGEGLGVVRTADGLEDHRAVGAGRRDLGQAEIRVDAALAGQLRDELVVPTEGREAGRLDDDVSEEPLGRQLDLAEKAVVDADDDQHHGHAKGHGRDRYQRQIAPLKVSQAKEKLVHG